MYAYFFCLTSLPNRRNFFLYCRRTEANAELESCAKGGARKNHFFALLPSRATLTSRSLRFRLCSPKIRQQLRLFCRLRFNMLFCCSLNFHKFFSAVFSDEYCLVQVCLLDFFKSKSFTSNPPPLKIKVES